MLRDFVYTLNPVTVGNVLKEFDLELPEASTLIALVEFKIVTPDSFLWRFMIDDTIYYLYAEDLARSLDEIKGKVERNIRQTPVPELEFVPVKVPKNFDTSGPVTSARTFIEPDDPDELMKYAADAELDFAFLLRSDEDAEEAYFND